MDDHDAVTTGSTGPCFERAQVYWAMQDMRILVRLDDRGVWRIKTTKKCSWKEEKNDEKCMSVFCRSLDDL
jgi:hypothetical protein